MICVFTYAAVPVRSALSSAYSNAVLNESLLIRNHPLEPQRNDARGEAPQALHASGVIAESELTGDEERQAFELEDLVLIIAALCLEHEKPLVCRRGVAGGELEPRQGERGVHREQRNDMRRIADSPCQHALKSVLFNDLLRVGAIAGTRELLDPPNVDMREPMLSLQVLRHGARLEQQALHAGISLVPEDRKTEGLFLHLSGKANASLPILDRLAKFGWIDRRAEAAAADAIFAQLNVPPRALYRPASSFSGGNQQKIVLAKSLLSESEVLLLFDPTRGVDIATKHEIYLLVRDLAAAGKTILLYSTEVSEIVNLCDRALVLYRGRLAAELPREQLTEENILIAALGNAGTGAQL